MDERKPLPDPHVDSTYTRLESRPHASFLNQSPRTRNLLRHDTWQMGH